MLNSKKGNSRLEFLYNSNLINSKRSQIWIETVVYTLIGLSIIAIIMTMALPQIDKSKDRAIIEQTISALNDLDKKISEVEQGPGSVGVVDFKIAKGKIDINATDNLIVYTLEDTKLELLEVGQEKKNGNIIMKTEQMPAGFRITLTLKYQNLNLTNKDGGGIKTLSAGATPYRIVISNKESTEIGQNTELEFSIL